MSIDGICNAVQEVDNRLETLVYEFDRASSDLIDELRNRIDRRSDNSATSITNTCD
jgi:hypothetical protein